MKTIKEVFTAMPSLMDFLRTHDRALMRDFATAGDNLASDDGAGGDSGNGDSDGRARHSNEDAQRELMEEHRKRVAQLRAMLESKVMSSFDSRIVVVDK